ncbi:MAG: ATP-binding protein [Alphaproteobacteria bacterium]|nr:ATP-binding protein [Alphaproteobacteria bacterium]
MLAVSVVHAFPDPVLRPPPSASHRYKEILLLEDWLDCSGARSFVDAVQAGVITLDGKELSRGSAAMWQSEFVSPPNPFMDRIGFVVQTRFETRQIALTQEPLFTVSEPYYPDAAGALQDWSQFVQHHGHSDARNGNIIFLLPEARAFFTEASSDKGVLRLKLAGSDVGRASLIVKGAYWQDRKIHHFQRAVEGDHVELAVPSEVERLEYVLIGDGGEMYDLQREGWRATSGITRLRTEREDDALVRQVRAALEIGEGEEIEFKPFIDPTQPLGSVREKSKLREILRTIAAFANTDGGCIFLGISDDCSLGGIQVDLAKWTDAEAGAEACNRYKGTLTNKIKGELLGDCRFWMAFADVDGATVAIMTVSRFELAPVGLRDEGLCYVRRGASNRFLSPHEWHTIFGHGP